MEGHGKVSVIMSAWNTGETIGRAIGSVLGQTYNDIELVIVDDCSADNTAEVVKTYDDRRIKYVRNERNMGAGWARDIGIQRSTGYWIAFLDSDDWLAPDYIEALVGCAVANGADIAGGGYTVVDGGRSWEVLPGIGGVAADKYMAADGGIDTVYRFLNVTVSRRELWGNFRYSHLRFQEDSTSILFLLYFAKRRAFVRNAGYYYWQNPASLVHTASEARQAVYAALAAMEVYGFFTEHDKPMRTLLPFRMALSRLFKSAEDEAGEAELREYSRQLGEIFVFAMRHRH